MTGTLIHNQEGTLIKDGHFASQLKLSQKQLHLLEVAVTNLQLV